MRKRILSAALLSCGLAAAVLTPSVSRAALIDFEVDPGGAVPGDDTALPTGSAYTNTPGVQVTFGFDSDSNGSVDAPGFFESAGPDGGGAGFAGSDGTDTADSGFGAQLGSWFLRSGTAGGPFGKFVITYTSGFAVTACSGEIWDIDGTGTDIQPGFTEQYLVEAYDSSNNLLASSTSPLGTLTSAIAPLDGRPWTFSFSGLTAGIDHIEITFTGTKTMGIGLAFNNFDPTAPVPEPASAGLVALTVGATAMRRRRVV
jgi:hypothetical protein